MDICSMTICTQGFAMNKDSLGVREEISSIATKFSAAYSRKKAASVKRDSLEVC